MKAFSITDIGQGRNVNQDYVYCEKSPIGNLPNLFIVADGMGGHNAGDYASRFCVEFFTQRIRESKSTLPVTMFEKALKKTNDILRSKSQDSAEFEGMGTTFVVATIVDKVMYVANIGDSRLYIINDEIKQITQDHSLVEAMIRTGEINRDEARVHPNKNIITRALGAIDTVEADYFEVDINDGDIVLMCSDGLTNMLEDERITDIIRNNSEDIEATAADLVNSANQNGGKDNISVILIKV